MQAGSSSAGGRTSAAVTQDTDKRSSASAGKASSNDKLDLVSFTALQHNHVFIVSNFQVPTRTTTHTLSVGPYCI
jgi:Histidyl-tRNA synthetase